MIDSHSPRVTDACLVGVAGVHVQRFGYDAIDTRGRRRAPIVDHRREDEVLTSSGRAQLSSVSRDIVRNFSIARWMISKHLDFVSRVRFQARSQDDGLNRALEQFVEAISTKQNVEASRRFRLGKLIRLVEARRTLDGDVGLLKLRSGLVQAIEGDRVRNERGALTGSNGWYHGIRITDSGRHVEYAIHRRERGGWYTFERNVPARRMFWHGYFDRFDQTRGVSPMAAAIAPLQHTYENFDFALAKAKVSQLLGLVFTSQYSDVEALPGQGFGETEVAETDTAGNATRYKVDVGRGIWKAELDPGDDAKILESQTPSNQFQSFHDSIVEAAMSALGLPYVFYRTNAGNFHSSLRALQLYMRSAKDKIEDNAELLGDWLRWRIAVAVQAGDFDLPSGMLVSDLPFAWIADGVPWWDKAKEMRGHMLAISAGIDNPQRIAAEYGTDFYDNIERIAEAVSFANDRLAQHGYKLSFDGGPDIIDLEQFGEKGMG